MHFAADSVTEDRQVRTVHFAIISVVGKVKGTFATRMRTLAKRAKIVKLHGYGPYLIRLKPDLW